MGRGSGKKGMFKLAQLLAQPGRSEHQLHSADGETKSRRTQQLVQGWRWDATVGSVWCRLSAGRVFS